MRANSNYSTISNKKKMKKTSTFLLLLGCVLSSFLGYSQANRMVLVEQFTNASCGPCAVYGPAFQAILDANTSRCVVLKYQCDFPGADPMNAQNKADVTGRYTTYPSVPSTGIPYMAMDGNKFTGHIANFNQNLLTNRANVKSPLELKVDHLLSPKFDSMTIDVNLKNVSTAAILPNAAILQVVITERKIVFASAPGSNGEKEFHSVMRKLLPNFNGTALTDSIQPGATKSFQFKAAVPSYIYDYTQLEVVSFVQMKTSKEILQAGISEAKPLTGNYYDIANKYTPEVRTDNCDNVYSVEIAIENKSSSTEPITRIVFTPLVNGARKTKSVWTGSIASGAKANHKISNLSLVNGINRIGVVVDSVYNASGLVKDVSSVNNLSDEYRELVIPKTTTKTTLTQGFEVGSPGAVPAGVYYFTTSPSSFRMFTLQKAQANNGTSVPPYELGGYGKSANSVYMELPGGAPGSQNSINFEKTNLTGTTGNKLKFTYAYATTDDANTDKLDVEASTDCGQTWKTIWTKSGAELATVKSPDPSTFHITGIWFPTNETEWTSDSVNMAKYDGGEVLIRFTAYGGGGGYALFLDDVNLAPGTFVGVPQIDFISSFDVFPNPATNVLNIELNSKVDAKVNIRIVDIQGKVVTQWPNEKLNFGYNTFKKSIDLAPGLYHMEIVSDQGILTQKISVQ